MMHEARLRWHEHKIWSREDSVAKNAMQLSLSKRRLKKQCLDWIKEDMWQANNASEETVDQAKWKMVLQAWRAYMWE